MTSKKKATPSTEARTGAWYVRKRDGMKVKVENTSKGSLVVTYVTWPNLSIYTVTKRGFEKSYREATDAEKPPGVE